MTTSPLMRARVTMDIVRTTLAPTMLQAGFRFNWLDWSGYSNIVYNYINFSVMIYTLCIY